MITGYYFLSDDGHLQYNSKISPVELRDDKDVVMFWPVGDSRELAWEMLVQSLSCGAAKEEVIHLADKWGCNDADAAIYAEMIGADLSVDEFFKMAATKSFINIQESPCGFGETYLEAMANLCAALGYKPQKMWGATFASLVKKHNEN